MNENLLHRARDASNGSLQTKTAARCGPPYKNGKFVSDDPDFVTGSDDPALLVFGPLASVHLNDPEKRWLDFPLVRGKQWRFRYEHAGYITGKIRWFSAHADVIGLLPEPLETIAGKFRVIEIQRTDTAKGRRNLTYFYSPETKSVVKLEIKTRWRHVQLELIEYGHKDPVVQAPVYEDGDWWVFRVKEDQKRPWNARVTYKDGKFQSDEPSFLRGEDFPGTRIIFGSALVYLNDPKNKGLEFPLVPGKKWSFRYRVPGGSKYGPSPWGFAEVEVIGPVAQPVKTPAGSFNVIEIRRTDSVGYKYTEITYFYSPESKSVVKITGVHEPLSGGLGSYGGGIYKIHAELELIEYGRKAALSEQPVVKAPVIE